MKELTEKEMLEINGGCIGCHGEGTGNPKDRPRDRPERDRDRYERDRERRERNR